MTQPRSPHRGYMGSSTGQWMAATALLVAFVVLAWVQRVPSLTTANDDATYILLARSLREGGFNSIHLVDAPVHTKYPPLFPALLAGITAVAGESIDAFVAMNIVLAAAALALTFAVAKRLWPPTVALGALAIAASSPSLQGIAGTVMSEPTFLALTGLTLWLLAAPPLTTGRVALACVCASLAALTRTVGATLVLAVIGLLLLERRWRAAAVYTAIVAVIVIGASLWLRARAMPVLAADYITDAVEAGQVASANPLVVVGRRVAINAPQYAGSLLSVLSFPTIRGTLIDNFVWLAVTCLALAAGAWLFWRQWRIAVLFGFVYGTLLLVWPWAIGRFLVPVLPSIAVAFLAGAYVLMAKWNRRAAPAVVVALAAVMTATGAVRGADRVALKRRCEREQAMQSPSCFNADQLSFFEAARYVAGNTPQSAVFISPNEAMFHYLSGRRVVAIDSINARPPERAAEFLQREGVSYVILNHVSFDALELSVRLMSACDRLRPVREFPPRTTLFLVLPTAVADSRACEILRAYARDADEFRPQIF